MPDLCTCGHHLAKHMTLSEGEPVLCYDMSAIGGCDCPGFDLSAKTSAGDAEEGADRHGDADGTGATPATPAPVPADKTLRGSNSGGGAATAVDNDVDPADRAATPPAGPATPLTLETLLEILEDVATTRDLDDGGDWEVEA